MRNPARSGRQVPQVFETEIENLVELHVWGLGSVELF